MKVFSFATMPTTRVVVWLLLVSAHSTALAQTAQRLGAEDNRTSRISKVFINLTGDVRLSHRLWSFIDFELEDAGIALMNTEDGADAVINGNVDPQSTNHRLGLGVARFELTVNGKTEKVDSCESLNTDENGEVFDQSAKGIAEKIHEKYPNARTVKLDPASNTQASETFGAELPGWLKKAGLSVVERTPADVILRADLLREKVPIEEDGVKYEIAVLSRDGSMLFNQSGSGVTLAKLTGRAPELCPDRAADLELLYNNDDPLFRLAQNLAREVRKHNMKMSVSPSGRVVTR